jgi:hypothetical protein
MSGECNRCSEHTLDCTCTKDLSSRMIETIIRLGRAQQYLDSIMETDLFCNLSKHRYWDSEDYEQSKFLNDKRMHISCLQDNLFTLSGILNGD